MAADDLGMPLGSGRKKRSSRRVSVPLLPLITALLACIVVVGLVWIALVDDPLGGEPFAVAKIETPAAIENAPPAEPPVPAMPGEVKSKSRTVTIIDGKSGARTTVSVSDGVDEPARLAEPLDIRIVESSRHGLIPRIAPDGTRPLDVFARAPGASAAQDAPSIAIVMTGLGVSAAATGAAVAALPGGVTLAFVPYGAELSHWITEARSGGHELLLQIPMEPFDYPDNDPGPRALLSSLPADQNLDHLHWFLSRAQGYVGVTHFMGARFTASKDALTPVLTDIAKRGLLYFDDASSPRSMAQQAAAGTKLPFVAADIVVDATPSWSEIDAALERLERIAAERGFAVGAASALPVSIERIARWIKAAEARGVRIVPLSAVAARSRQS